MAQNLHPVKDERSLGELFADLSRETTTLVRQEIDLARAEIGSKATRIGKDAGLLIAGGLVAYAGLLALIATAIIALSYALPWWLAALLVGVVVTGAGYILVQRGIAALKQVNLAPQQTITTLKEDAQWAKEQVR
ncbi:MAG TPA: phage holin family protein [Chloroflexota bacterium]|nr:phage holin family protein [Chloroflexota bacterium]